MVGEKTTLEKSLVGRNRLPQGGPGGKAPNRELPPKSGDITCMVTHPVIGGYQLSVQSEII